MVVTVHSVISLCLLDEDQIPEPVTCGVPCSSNSALVWFGFAFSQNILRYLPLYRLG